MLLTQSCGSPSTLFVPFPLRSMGSPLLLWGSSAPSDECSRVFGDHAIQCCWLQLSQLLMFNWRARAGGNWEESPLALLLRNTTTPAFAPFPPSTPSPRGNMELCSLSNSHSGAYTNGEESETQLLVLDAHEVCQEAAGDTRQVGGSDTSFSAVEQLCLVFSWLEHT